MGSASSTEFAESLRRRQAGRIQDAVLKNTALTEVHLAEDGTTAWHVMADAGRCEIMQSMLDAVIRHKQTKRKYRVAPRLLPLKLQQLLDQRNANGQTPLMVACSRGHRQCVTWLLEQGVDPWVKTDFACGELSALHYAVASGSKDCAIALLTHVEENRQLRIRHHPNRFADIRSMSAFTALHYAAWFNRQDMVKMLSQFQADLTCQCQISKFEEVFMRPGSTPLHFVARFGREEFIKEMLAAYVQRFPSLPRSYDPRRVRDSRQELPFHLAMQHRQHHVVTWLHPATPLRDVVSHMTLEGRGATGPPRLMDIVAPIAQSVLLATLDALQRDRNTHGLHKRDRAFSRLHHRRQPTAHPHPHPSTRAAAALQGAVTPTHAAHQHHQNDDESHHMYSSASIQQHDDHMFQSFQSASNSHDTVGGAAATVSAATAAAGGRSRMAPSATATTTTPKGPNSPPSASPPTPDPPSTEATAADGDAAAAPDSAAAAVSASVGPSAADGGTVGRDAEHSPLADGGVSRGDKFFGAGVGAVEFMARHSEDVARGGSNGGGGSGGGGPADWMPVVSRAAPHVVAFASEPLTVGPFAELTASVAALSADVAAAAVAAAGLTYSQEVASEPLAMRSRAGSVRSLFHLANCRLSTEENRRVSLALLGVDGGTGARLVANAMDLSRVEHLSSGFKQSGHNALSSDKMGPGSPPRAATSFILCGSPAHSRFVPGGDLMAAAAAGRQDPATPLLTLQRVTSSCAPNTAHRNVDVGAPTPHFVSTLQSLTHNSGAVASDCLTSRDDPALAAGAGSPLMAHDDQRMSASLDLARSSSAASPNTALGPPAARGATRQGLASFSLIGVLLPVDEPPRLIINHVGDASGTSPSPFATVGSIGVNPGDGAAVAGLGDEGASGALLPAGSSPGSLCLSRVMSSRVALLNSLTQMRLAGMMRAASGADCFEANVRSVAAQLRSTSRLMVAGAHGDGGGFCSVLPDGDEAREEGVSAERRQGDESSDAVEIVDISSGAEAERASGTASSVWADSSASATAHTPNQMGVGVAVSKAGDAALRHDQRTTPGAAAAAAARNFAAPRQEQRPMPGKLISSAAPRQEQRPSAPGSPAAMVVGSSAAQQAAFDKVDPRAIADLTSALADILEDTVANDVHEASQDLDDMCAVCMDDDPEWLVVQPCTHRLCFSCCRELVNISVRTAALCPFCRRIILGFDW